ncbi:MAG: hypothetical protein MRY83_09255, partial [Flavobacteriales bacterium]|nr:hypothetical protein [Flavobacteriales bacterium]
EMEKLEEWQRTLLLMRAQSYTYEEIAPYVDKPANQLKVYYMRLKKRIYDNLKSDLDKLS